MYKVTVTIPAPVTSLGPGLHSLGLALAMHCHIEMTARRDDQLELRYEGEGLGALPGGYRHPVIEAMTRMFQYKEMAPVGLTVAVENQIPLGVGLDAVTALKVGALVAANNFTGGGLEREGIIEIALDMGLLPEAIVTAMMGGLNFCLPEERHPLIYNSLEPPPLRLALVVPELPDYPDQTADILPAQVALEDAVFNLSRLPFAIDALLDGDFNMLKKTLQDRLYQDAYTDYIPGYEGAQQAALKAGAAVVTLAGRGPAVIAFAPYNHALIAEAMVEAFQREGVEHCRYWTLGIDVQGVTLSIIE